MKRSREIAKYFSGFEASAGIELGFGLWTWRGDRRPG